MRGKYATDWATSATHWHRLERQPFSSQSLEPHCFDAEGSATVLPMELRRTELLREGKSTEEIDREIAAGLLTGKYRLPRRPAMSYMMSPEQVLYNDEGRKASADLGLGGTPSTQAALVVDEGKSVSNIMIVVKDFAGP